MAKALRAKITRFEHPELQSAHELTDDERKEFDYIDDLDEQFDRFFRYRGSIYDSHEFIRIVPKGGTSVGFEHHDLSGDLKGWHGIHCDSFFSAIVIRISNDNELTVALYLP